MKVVWLFGILMIPLFSTNLNAQCLSGDCYDGLGTYKYPSGAKYVGRFVKGKLNGTGTLYSKNGNKYQGQWRDHYKHGKGEMLFANGDRYVGQFAKSKFQGKGIMQFANQDAYDGQWKEDQMHGRGRYAFHNGDLYEGEFEEGKMDGFGIMFYSTGAVYEGEWRLNKKEGRGKFKNAQGRSTTGIWSNGEFLNKTNNATRPTSNAAYSSNTSRGDYKYRDGSRWVGDLKDGKPFGNGILYYASGDRYEGGWAKHSPHGEGTMYYPNGKTFAAVWEYGLPQERKPTVARYEPSEKVLVENSSAVKVWAVVIGVARYTHMPVLKYTDDDAYQIYAFLKSPEGGALPDEQINVLVDDTATRENILRTMRKTFLKADKNDVVLLYFSGHGLSGSFLPFDFDGYNNQVMHDEIQDIFEESQAKHKICFADACHSGNMLASRGANFQQSIKDYYNAFDDTYGGTALLLSSKGDEYSLEDQGLRQGIFSHFLMKGLKGKADTDGNQIVTISELYNYVSREVTRYTSNAQNPMISGKYDPKMPVSTVR